MTNPARPKAPDKRTPADFLRATVIQLDAAHMAINGLALDPPAQSVPVAMASLLIAVDYLTSAVAGLAVYVKAVAGEGAPDVPRSPTPAADTDPGRALAQ